MPRKKKSNKVQASNSTKDLLSYKTNEGVKTPVTRIVAGSNVTVERAKDVTGQFELDEVTISSTGGSSAEVEVESEGTPVTGNLSICSGSIDIDLGIELKALSNFNETGIMSRTGVGTYKGRALQAGDNITIINPDGIDGDPVISSTGGGGGGGNITLTGSVTGSGSSTINTSLFKRQIMPGGELGWYWGNSYPRVEHSLPDDDYPRINFSYGVIGFNERSWTQSFFVGKYGDYNGIYALDFADDVDGNHRPISIVMQPEAHKANIYLDGQLNVRSNRITKVADPVEPDDAVTLRYFETHGGGGGGGGSSINSVGISGGDGLEVTNSPLTSSGTINVALTPELKKLSSFNAEGLVYRSSVGDYSSKSILAGNNVEITEGEDGITISATGGSGGTGTVTEVRLRSYSSGLKTVGSIVTSSGTLGLQLNDDLQKISEMDTGTFGFVTRLNNRYATRVLQAGDGIQITSPNGLAGNPVISVTGGGGGGGNITLTGSVTGSGTDTINTKLNPIQDLGASRVLRYNWENGYPTLEYNIPEDNGTTLANNIGTLGGVADRYWRQEYNIGDSDTWSGKYFLRFIHSKSATARTPFAIYMRDYNDPNLQKADIIFDGLMQLSGNRIVSVADPIADQDVVTKKYFETHGGGGGGGSINSVGISGGTGLTVDNSPLTSSGTINLTLSPELEKLSDYNGVGLLSRSDTGDYNPKTLIAGDNINIIESDNDITINSTTALSPELEKLSSYNGVGLLSRSDTGEYSPKNIVAGDNVTITEVGSDITINSTGGGISLPDIDVYGSKHLTFDFHDPYFGYVVNYVGRGDVDQSGEEEDLYFKTIYGTNEETVGVKRNFDWTYALGNETNQYFNSAVLSSNVASNSKELLRLQSSDSGYLDGVFFNTPLHLNSNRIIGLPDEFLDPSEAVSKKYVDEVGDGTIVVTGDVNGEGTVRSGIALTLNPNLDLTSGYLNLIYSNNSRHSESFSSNQFLNNWTVGYDNKYYSWNVLKRCNENNESYELSINHDSLGKIDIYKINRDAFTMHVPIVMGGNKIAEVPDPVDDGDAANKAYVDGQFITGEYKLIARDDAPNGWLKCDGSEVLAISYPDLYELIGDKFGDAVDGKFRLPDFSSSIPVSTRSDRDIGGRVGSNLKQMTTNQMPAHNHIGVTAEKSAYESGTYRFQLTSNARTPETQVRDRNNGRGVAHRFGQQTFRTMPVSDTHDHTFITDIVGANEPFNVEQSGLVAGSWFIKN